MLKGWLGMPKDWLTMLSSWLGNTQKEPKRSHEGFGLPPAEPAAATRRLVPGGPAKGYGWGFPLQLPETPAHNVHTPRCVPNAGRVCATALRTWGKNDENKLC